MSETVTPESTPKSTTPSGCAPFLKIGCLVPIGLIALVIVIGLVWNLVTGGPDMVMMRGEVVLHSPDSFIVAGKTCAGLGDFIEMREGTEVRVIPSSGGVVRVPLREGFVDTSGNCIFFFWQDVRVADSYRFEVGDFEQGPWQYSVLDRLDDDGEEFIEPKLNLAEF